MDSTQENVGTAHDHRSTYNTTNKVLNYIRNESCIEISCS